MSFINSIQSMLPRPENRSRDQIAHDLDDEFNFHLEMKTRALQSEEGLDREAACGLARDRFGDIDRIRNDCQRIALRERIMLQRVNFVLMVVVTLLVIAVGAQVMITQRYNTLALQAITADLAKMKFDAMGAARDAGTGEAPSTGLVYLRGAVPRAGVYNLPPNGVLTIARLLTASGVVQNELNDARISLKRREGNDWRTFNYALDDAGIADFVLQSDDELTVVAGGDNAAPGQPAAMQLPIGPWRQVDNAGNIVADGGATLEIIAHDDIRNLKGVPIGIVTLPDAMMQKLRVSFSPSPQAQNLQIEEFVSTTHLQSGRWDYRAGRLSLNIAPAVREITEPLTFMPAGGLAGVAAADARAAAVGDFVVRLFALADPNDPNLDQTVRNFLDSEEKAADQKYANDPATAGMIKELIAARRRIFESDEAIQRAATAEQKAEAVSDFLKDVLASTDTTAPSINVSDVLDNASKRVEEQFADNPELRAQMRERIAEAQKNIANQPAATNPDDEANGPPGADHSLEASPFQAVRWKNQWTPIVNYAGEWYELRTIHGADAGSIVQHCMQKHGEARVRLRFSEDLLTMLVEMGYDQPESDRVKMQIVDLRSGSLIAVNEAELSADNREKIIAENAAATASGKQFPEFVESAP